ncbi:unnamed protein product, partial [Ectocarpus fasciculatus]
EDVLSSPYGLRVKNTDGTTVSGARGGEPQWLVQSDEELVLRIPGISEASSSPLVEEAWTLSLRRGQRAVGLEIEGRTLRADDAVAAVYHGLYMKSASIYGLFDGRGVAQMMNKTDACLGSNQTMSRAYALGNGAALDYVRHDLAVTPRQVVLSTMGREGHWTGIEDIDIGAYPELSLSAAAAWRECWPQAALTVAAVRPGMRYSSSVSFVPNNFDFPAFLLQDVTTQPAMPFEDIRSLLTGIYGSPAGCLQSYFEDRWGTIAPTISHPDVGYAPDTNFFDPDNFIALSALMYSGDDFMIEEVRRVLERTSNTMCGLGSEQLMHHFVDLVPTYESIAGSEQLGPNIFWTWTCLRYISLTQDFEWAKKMLPYLDSSVKYLLTFYDESKGMIYAPGPLWIDVLVRENYTSDSNAAMVPFLQLAADAYDVFGEMWGGGEKGDNFIRFAEELRHISETIANTMATELWDAESNDHFITQLDPSGDKRDFVDYDSNLLAVAFGAVSLGARGDADAALERAESILTRVDAGDYTHVRATWCSEIPYSGDACDCYIVGGTVCGDSVVTLARIGWADAHARKLVGDISTFDSLLLSPLQEDLINDVWLYERYDDTGTQIRTSYYFEYPSLVAMMLREIRYGISIGLKQIDISPFMNPEEREKEFVYSFGNMYLSYSSERVELRLPSVAENTRILTVHGLVSGRIYALSGCNQVGSTA